MLFLNVCKILDVAKEKDVDISVAKAMVIHEDKEKADEIKSAFAFIKNYYKYITSCRVAGDNESIEKLCELFTDGDFEAIGDIMYEFNK